MAVVELDSHSVTAILWFGSGRGKALVYLVAARLSPKVGAGVGEILVLAELTPLSSAQTADRIKTKYQ
jgi:hypothetical protein